MLHWKNEGLVLKAVPDDPDHDLHPGKVAERPKVIYNRATRKTVSGSTSIRRITPPRAPGLRSAIV